MLKYGIVLAFARNNAVSPQRYPFGDGTKQQLVPDLSHGQCQEFA